MNQENNEAYLKFMFFHERLPENRIISVQTKDLNNIRSEIFVKFGISSDLSFYNKYGIQIFDDFLPSSEGCFYYVQESEKDFNVQILLEDYILIKLLGQGGYGKVIQVRHFFDGNIIAIKIVNYSNVLTSLSINSFKEALIIKGLHHPNIIHLYNAFLKNGTLYLLMEYISNGSLSFFLNSTNSSNNLTYSNALMLTKQTKKIKSEKIINIHDIKNDLKISEGSISSNFYLRNIDYTKREEIARKIFIQIINVLSYCHERKIAHRDLKLENIMLSNIRNYSIKVIDFGIASIGSELSTAGTILYLAPEVFIKSVLSLIRDAPICRIFGQVE